MLTLPSWQVSSFAVRCRGMKWEPGATPGQSRCCEFQKRIKKEETRATALRHRP